MKRAVCAQANAQRTGNVHRMVREPAVLRLVFSFWRSAQCSAGAAQPPETSETSRGEKGKERWGREDGEALLVQRGEIDVGDGDLKPASLSHIGLPPAPGPLQGLLAAPSLGTVIHRRGCLRRAVGGRGWGVALGSPLPQWGPERVPGRPRRRGTALALVFHRGPC